jgi:hypothetical protein
VHEWDEPATQGKVLYPLETTMVYFHFTRKGTEDAYKIIDNFMKGFNRALN